MKTLTKFIYLAFAAVALVCFALSPAAQAVVPAPDGAYPGFNTAEGGPTALGQAVPGVWNTAIGQFALNADVTGSFGNTAVGLNALRANTLGDFNSALGVNALRFNVIGSNNTALGYLALFVNTGDMNTAVGVNALSHNTTGFDNTAVGQGALTGNIDGTFNTATGFRALASNTHGINDTANGSFALISNTTGVNNTAVGGLALSTNTTLGNNTAVGWKALQFSNPVAAGADPNTAVGSLALLNNTIGQANDAFGFQALINNTDGVANAAHGSFALASNTHGIWNVAFGTAALASNIAGNFNTAVGVEAGEAITGDLNIDIGAAVVGVAGENNTTRIGIATGTGAQTACYIGGISGVNEGGSGILPVQINNAGRLGTTPSSRRFKNEIKPMEKTSEAILGLKPVTFHYKSDGTGTPQFGLIAEEVAQVNPDLVVRDNKGEIYTVRYDAVNAMLLNEFLKEHRTVQGQQKEIDALKAELKEQKALIQKVSDKVEINKPTPKVVLNNP